MAKSCYLIAFKRPAIRIPTEDINPPMRKQRRAQNKVLANETELEKVDEEMMEISMEDLVSRPNGTPRPQT